MMRARTFIILGFVPLTLTHFASGMTRSDAPPVGVTVDTVAGGKVPDGLPAQNVLLQNLGGIAWDSAGNLVFCDTGHDSIRRVRTDGRVDTIAGTGVTGFAGDGGPATSALLNQPKLPRYDSAGNLYFYDSQNLRIRRVDSHGVIASVAGDGILFVTGDDLTGPASARSIAPVADMTVDGSGNLYLVESALNTVRRVTPAGILELFAGTSTPTCTNCSNGDGGPATMATLYQPGGAVADSVGNIYIEDGAPSFTAPGPSIRRVSPNGIIATFLKASVLFFDHNTVMTFDLPGGLTADPAGNLYAVHNSAIVRLNPDGTTTAIAGGASNALSSSPDGPALPSSISPSSLTADAQGNVAFIDPVNVPFINSLAVELREVTPQSMLKTLAGATPVAAPDGTAPRAAWFLNPNSMAFDHNGNLYIAESQTCLIRKIDTNGVLSTFAGTGKCAYPAPSGTAKGDLAPVGSLAFDSQNRLWVADLYLNLYRINLDGSISFYATRTPVSGTTGQIAIDNKDRVYVLGLNSLYRILADGTTLQPVIPPPESGGTGLPSDLLGLGVDPAENMYFGSNDTVYRVNDDATFTAYVSGGIGGGFVGHGFAVDAAGTVWAGSCFLHAAGSGCLGVASGFAGDGGLAQEARISASQSLFAPNGNLYMLAVDRVRELIGLGVTSAAPVISAGGIVNALSYGGGAVAPGEIISIFGSNFGSSGSNAAVNNAIPVALGRTKVVIGARDMPILAVTANQINAILPGDLGSAGSVPIAVQVDGMLSSTVMLPLAAAAPGLATADSSGTGEGAILNQDGSINSRANPALRGSVISLFGTGSGAATRQIPAGALVLSTPYPAPQNNVTVAIGGHPAQVLYAGAAPTLPNGVLQINARVPANIVAGDAVVTVTIGGIAMSQLVTVSVK